MKTLHCVVSGLVQGVYFRAWTRSRARELGLAGWVRNLPGGQVEVMAQGDEEALAGLLESLHHGPPFARVARVDSRLVDGREPMAEFTVTR